MWKREDWTSQVAQLVKNPPTMQETQVQSLSQKDPLEKEIATHSGILGWKIPWTEEPAGYKGSQESDTIQWLNHHQKRED